MSKKTLQIIVADEFKLDINHFYLPIFPKTSRPRRHKFSYDENKNIHINSRILCMSIAEIFEEFCHQNILNDLKPPLKNIFYPFSYMFVNSYLSIFLRVKSSLQKNSKEQLATTNLFNLPKIYSFVQLQGSILSDWKFNQILVSRIAKVLGVNSFISIHDIRHIKENNFVKYKNLTSHPIASNKFEALTLKLLNRLSIFFRKFNFRKSDILLNFGFAHADYYLGLNLFFGPFGPIKECKNSLSQNEEKDNILRNFLKKKYYNKLFNEIKIYLQNNDSYSLSPDDINLCADDLINTLIDVIPINYFENLQVNLKLAFDDLRNAKGIIGTDINTDKGYIYSCVTKHLKLKTIAVQHGGHSGYLESKNNSNEFYYYISDYLITWGWINFDTLLSPCKAIPLPSIRLAQFCKNKYFKYKHISKKEIEKKVLFFSLTIFRFTTFSNNLAISDYMQNIIKDKMEMVKFFKLKKIKIFYKTEKRSIKLFDTYYPMMKKLGGEFFEILDLPLRGISNDLVQKYSIIVFDEIGTGALECMTKGIPVMIYWKKIHCREASYAKLDIKKLKNSRVLFYDLESLTNELNKFFKNPYKWMNSETRKNNIKAFCNKYALTDKNWSKIWKKKLKEF